jgi:hypothetical protein
MNPPKTRVCSRFRALAVLACLAVSPACQQTFGALTFKNVDLGSPAYPGTYTTSPSTNTITAGGADIWGTSDAGHFVYTTITSPVWDAIVKVHDLHSPGSSWGKCELMVRADQGTGDPAADDMFIAEMTTQPNSYSCADANGVNWVVDQFRSTAAANADWIYNTQWAEVSHVYNAAGNPAPQFPNRWMRLSRQGSVFKTYDSTDGTNWNVSAVIDTANPSAQPAGNDNTSRFNTPFTNSVFVGIAVTAHNNGTDADGNQYVATAVFSDLTVNVSNDMLYLNDPAGLPVGFTIKVDNLGASIADPNTATLTFDGKPVTVTRYTQPTDKSSTTFYYYDIATALVAGSTHPMTITIKDTRGVSFNAPKTVTIPAYTTLTPDLAAKDVDTTKTGFNLRMHYRPNTDPQTTEPLAGYEMENTVARAEQQLYGTRGASILTAANSSFTADVINYSFDINSDGTTTQYGSFQAPDYPDTTPAGIDPNLDTSNIAAEIETYVYFPEAGVYSLIFNSDDGFRTTCGANVGEVLNSLLVGQYDGGRGSADTAAYVYVPTAGYFPMRTVWFQGGGGANLEWSGNEVVPTINSRRLLGDSTKPDALKVYRSRASVGPAAVTYMWPARSSGNPYLGDVRLDTEIQDGTGATVDQSSIKLLFNGTQVQPSVSKSGDRTKLSYTPAANLPPNTTNVVILSFTAGSQQYATTNTFTTDNTTIMPASFALTGVDTSKRGFLVRTVQNGIRPSNADPTDATADYDLPNSIYRAEIQLAGLLGWPNTADLSLFTTSGYYAETGTVNYNANGGNSGYFQDDLGVPGMPGTALQNGGNEEYSQEILTVLDLKPGIYVMNVNSDDNFSVYTGNPGECKTLPMRLGMYGANYTSDAGRGNGGGQRDGTFFNFEVKQAGLYPFRLVWEQGTGGHNVEWSVRSETNGVMIPIGHLVNDTSTAKGITAYQYPLSSAGAPYLKSFSPGRSSLDSAASRGRAGQDAVVKAVFNQGAGSINTNALSMTINGVGVQPAVAKSGSDVTVSYQPAGGFAMGSTNAVSLTLGDRTIGWSFIVGLPKTPTFWIEAVDFDYDSGKAKAEASVMPYLGGAYAGLGAVKGVDYDGRSTEPSNPYYRSPNTLGVPVSWTYEVDRGGGEVVVDYRLGWMGGGHWFNYTRNFPAGKYNVYAGLSSGATGDRIYGNLMDVTGGTQSVLGAFNSTMLTTGGGNWGNNNLVALKDAASTNNIVALDLSGTKTLRYNDGSGDIDFFLFTPVASEGLKITGVSIASGNLTITWTGGGSLQTTADLKGWADVPNSSGGTYTTAASAAHAYYRVKQ